MHTGDREAVEDLVVEALAHIASPKVLAHYRGEGPLDAFLARVGRNVITSRLRTRAGRREEAELRAEPPEAAEGTPSAEESVMRSTLTPALRDALDQLSERDREVVLMISLFDFSQQEAAEALGLKLGTVKSSHHRALAKLRAELGPDFGKEVSGAG